MTDTNMTDTNTPHGNGGGVSQGCGKHVRVLTTQKGLMKDRRRAAVGGVCGFVVCCAVSDTTPLLLVGVVVLGVLVVIVAGSRPVVLFEPGC